MRVSYLFLVIALSFGCGSTLKKESKLPTNSSSLNSESENPVSKKTPFKSTAEEDVFWQIVNLEADLETVPRTPVNRIALFLGLVLSPAPPPQERAEFLNQLLTKFQAFSTVPEDRIINQAIGDSANLPKRWMALQIVFKRDAEALAVLDYALNNEARMKEYFSKQHARMSQKPKVEKPEPVMPTPPPATGPVQRF